MLNRNTKELLHSSMKHKLALYWAAMGLAAFSGLLLLAGIGTNRILPGVFKGWMIVTIVFLLFMLVLSCFLVWHFLASMDRLLEEIRQDAVQDGKHFGISEFDELAEYIHSKEEEREERELPPEIEELFSDFSKRVATLTPMERTVLQFYIDGCSIEDVAARAFISVNTVKKHNTNINRKLGVTTREEMILYIDLFRRCGRLEEISYHVS